MPEETVSVEGRPAVAHRLAPLFNFSSIAVVGASDSAPGADEIAKILQKSSVTVATSVTADACAHPCGQSLE